MADLLVIVFRAQRSVRNRGAKIKFPVRFSGESLGLLR